MHTVMVLTRVVESTKGPDDVLAHIAGKLSPEKRQSLWVNYPEFLRTGPLYCLVTSVVTAQTVMED